MGKIEFKDCPLFIMTSTQNDAEVKSFFKENETEEKKAIGKCEYIDDYINNDKFLAYSLTHFFKLISFFKKFGFAPLKSLRYETKADSCGTFCFIIVIGFK